jgi:hypothetical protein
MVSSGHEAIALIASMHIVTRSNPQPSEAILTGELAATFVAEAEMVRGRFARIDARWMCSVPAGPPSEFSR